MFVCFLASALSSLGSLEVDVHIFYIACAGISLLYTIFGPMKSKNDRIFSIISLYFITAAEIFMLIEKVMNIPTLSLLFFGLISVVIKYNIETKTHIMVNILVPLVSVLVLSLGLYLLKMLNLYYFLYALDISIALLIFVLSFLSYKNGPVINKPNNFFMQAGAIFFILVLLSYFGIYMVADPTINAYSLFYLFSNTFYLPAIIMTTISFQIFETRDY